MASRLFLLYVLIPITYPNQINDLINGIEKVTDFGLKHHNQINFDGLLGFVIAEAQIWEILPYAGDLQNDLITILKKIEKFKREVILPIDPPKMLILEKFLLNLEGWKGEGFQHKSLKNLGFYQNWTIGDITQSKSASFKGVPSDHCLLEILQENCYVSNFCKEMMFSPRIDSGYLLSHRLFYLQIIRLKKCPFNENLFHSLTNRFCSLMLKELRTSAQLNFPVHDIALEQMVLCSIEGYSEFQVEKWRKLVLKWQTPFGCYKSKENDLRRSSNIIVYGCSDHTTGLGAAALALNLKYIIGI